MANNYSAREKKLASRFKVEALHTPSYDLIPVTSDLEMRMRDPSIAGSECDVLAHSLSTSSILLQAALLDSFSYTHSSNADVQCV